MGYSRISSVRIVNFQSILDETIELNTVNVICGPGDAGKSAILRAIRAAFLNDGNDRDIRHGEKSCSVSFIFEDGVEILWYKDKGKGGCYTLNGIGFTKTGGAVPEEIQDVFGVAEVELGPSNTVTPQLSDQFDRPVVLGESGSKRAKIIGKATRLDVVVTAQASCKTSADAHKRAATQEEQALESLASQLEALPNIEEYDSLSIKLTEVMEELDSILTVARRGRELAEELDVARSRLSTGDVSTIDIAGAQEALTKAEKVERVVVPYLQAREQAVSIFVPSLSNAFEVLEQARTVSIRTEQYLSSNKELNECVGEVIEEAKHQMQLAIDYQDACTVAGICLGCNGLKSHKECAV